MMKTKLKKTIKSTLLLLLASSCYASLTIGDYQPKKVVLSDAPNGNEITTVNDMPLDIYLQSIYSGYAVKFDQMNNTHVSIKKSDKVTNNAVSILSYLAKAYQISFELDNKTHSITVTPSNNVSYQSYKQGLKEINKERAALVLDHEQKTKDYDNVAQSNSDLYQKSQALSHSGDALNKQLVSMLNQYQYSSNPQEVANIKEALKQWRLTQKGVPYRLDNNAVVIQKVDKKPVEKAQAQQVINYQFIVSPFISKNEKNKKKRIEEIYSKNKKLVEDEKIKDSEFINAFTAELDSKNFYVYSNETTKKTAAAKTKENARLLTNNKVFYGFKGETVKDIFTQWGKLEHIDFDLSDVPASLLKIKLASDHIFKGEVITLKGQMNAVDELLKMAIVELKTQQQSIASKPKVKG